MMVKMAKRFLDISYNKSSNKWEVTLIDRETKKTEYRATGTTLLQATVNCLEFAENPDAVDHTDWAKATMGEIQKLLED